MDYTRVECDLFSIDFEKNQITIDVPKEVLEDGLHAGKLKVDFMPCKINNPKRKDKDREEDIHYSQAFVSFWNLYPSRNGKKLEKGVCLKMFKDLKKDDIPDILKAVKNYAESKQIKDGIGIKDPKRFIKNDFWKEWIEPEVTTESHGKEPENFMDRINKQMEIEKKEGRC